MIPALHSLLAFVTSPDFLVAFTGGLTIICFAAVVLHLGRTR